MKKTVLVMMALAGAVLTAQPALSPEQTLDRRGIGDLDFSPDRTREPHGLREEQHLLDRLTRIVAWYDKYLKPATSSETPRP